MDSRLNADALTGLRGLCCLLVVLHHASLLAVSDEFAFIRGQIWVDMFFVLSGFVLSLVYAKGLPVDWRRYAVARFARIYPLYFLTSFGMALGAVLMAMVQGQSLPESVTFSQAVKELFAVTAWPIWSVQYIWNYPAWSISVEVFLYIFIFPFFSCVVWRFPISSFLIALGVCVGLSVYLQFLGGHLVVTRSWIAIGRGAVGMVLGMSLLVLMRKQVLVLGYFASAHSVFFKDLFVFFYFTILLAVPFIVPIDLWLMTPLSVFVLFFILDSRTYFGRFFCLRPIMTLGDLSYSIYLIHAPILLVWAKISVIYFGYVFTNGVVVVVAIFTTVVFSLVSYVWIEMPIRSFINRRCA